MEKVIFVTGNVNKVVSARKIIDAAELEFFKYELIEPRSDSLCEIAEYKVREAYEIVKSPCIALDAGFYISALNGWPGTFVNFNKDKLGLLGILKLMEGVPDRSAYFKECLAYYDGIEIKYFYGVSMGTLANEVRGGNSEVAWSSLWEIFIPRNHDKTLSEMSDIERYDRDDGHTSSLVEFNNYLKKKEN